jgi:hypothetical protein
MTCLRETEAVGFFERRPPPGPYKTGEAVPRDGTVQCTQYFGTRSKVTDGTTFGRCSNWNSDNHGMRCTWQYVEDGTTGVARRPEYGLERGRGLIKLWAGWQLTLPNECMTERHPDGSWRAWDSGHTIDVRIVRVRRGRGGSQQDARAMLGREPNTTGAGWVGHAEEDCDSDDYGPVYRLVMTSAAQNTSLRCAVSYRDAAQRAWGETVVASIARVPPRRLFARSRP